MHYYFRFDLAPTSKERPRATRSGHFYTPAKTRQFESSVKTLARQHWGNKEPLEMNLEAILTFYSKRPKTTKLQYPRKDVDNLSKAVLDALNQVIYKDDSQIVKLTASKQWANEDFITIKLVEL